MEAEKEPVGWRAQGGCSKQRTQQVPVGTWRAEEASAREEREPVGLQHGKRPFGS